MRRPYLCIGHLPLQQALQASLAIVQARTQVCNDFHAPALRCAVGFQHFLLAFQVVFLAMARHPRIANRRGVFIAHCEQVVDCIVACSTVVKMVDFSYKPSSAIPADAV